MNSSITLYLFNDHLLFQTENIHGTKILIDILNQRSNASLKIVMFTAVQNI